MGDSRFNVLSWNVREIAREKLSRELDSMSTEFKWTVLLVQELTKASRFPLPASCNGYAFVADVPVGGIRVPGIILHEDVADMIVGKPVFENTAVAVLVNHPDLGATFYVSSHLDATSSRTLFKQSLTDLQKVLDLCPSEAGLVFGVDANCNLRDVDPEFILLDQCAEARGITLTHGKPDFLQRCC